MANVSTHNPWTLDTAATIKSHAVKIKKMVWHPSAGSQTLLVSDTSENPLFPSQTSIAAGDTVGAVEYDFGDGFWAQGFVLTTLTATGTLTVYTG